MVLYTSLEQTELIHFTCDVVHAERFSRQDVVGLETIIPVYLYQDRWFGAWLSHRGIDFDLLLFGYSNQKVL